MNASWSSFPMSLCRRSLRESFEVVRITSQQRISERFDEQIVGVPLTMGMIVDVSSMSWRGR